MLKNVTDKKAQAAMKLVQELHDTAAQAIEEAEIQRRVSDELRATNREIYERNRRLETVEARLPELSAQYLVSALHKDDILALEKILSKYPNTYLCQQMLKTINRMKKRPVRRIQSDVILK